MIFMFISIYIFIHKANKKEKHQSFLLYPDLIKLIDKKKMSVCLMENYEIWVEIRSYPYQCF